MTGCVANSSRCIVGLMSDDERLREAHRRFGENLRAVREHRGAGQRELAAKMAERGYRWHQNTVTRVEAGMRAVTFDEAQALAAVLGVTTDRFSWLLPEAAGVAVVGDAAARLSAAYLAAARAHAELRAARDAAGVALAGHRDSRYQRVRDVCEGLDAALAQETPEAALAEGTALLEEEGKR